MFSDEDYEGFVFIQDVTCNINDSWDTRQLDPSSQSINHGHIQEQETTEKYP